MKALRRLEPLLNLHRLRRRVLKQLLAALRGQHEELFRKLEALGLERARVRSWNSEKLSEGSQAGHSHMAEVWALAAERQAAELRTRMAELALQIEDANRRYVKASQDLKMLSTLQERRIARERDLAAKREQTELDEMASHCVAQS
jgi:flagellar export protein FliJ